MNAAVIMHSITSVCLSVCLSVCPVYALTFESLDLESLYLFASTSLEYLGHVRISRSSYEGQSYGNKNVMYEHNQMHTFVGGRHFIYLFIYLFISTQQKDQRPLTLSVKIQEVKSTCNTQSTKHREIETKK